MNKLYYTFYVGRKLTFILGLVMAAIYHQAKAQNPGEIWGMTSAGGAFGVGTIYKAASDGSNFSVQYSFNTPAPGLAFNCSLTSAPDGKLYGFTRAGGIYSSGVIEERSSRMREEHFSLREHAKGLYILNPNGK